MREFNVKQAGMSEPPPPLDLVLSDNAVNILGDNGRRRFETFRNYPDGWEGGRGRSLSADSLAALERFLRYVPELAAFRPSLFLTYDGNLQLGWEDRNHRDIELDFFPDRLDYFFGEADDEGSLGLEEMDRLVKRVKELVS